MDEDSLGTIQILAQEIEQGLGEVFPVLRRTVIRKLAPTVAAVIQTQTANTAMWASVLPIETERADMRLQFPGFWRTDFWTGNESWSRLHAAS